MIDPHLAYCETLRCGNLREVYLQHCDTCLQSKPLISLDLDETLIYSCRLQLKTMITPENIPSKLVPMPDFFFPTFVVYKRPWLDFFLDQLFQKYRVGFWSAGAPLYVHSVLPLLLKPNQKPEFIFTAPNCLYEDELRQSAFKPLSFISKNLENMRHIDDQKKAMFYNQDQGILIKAFANPKEQQNDTCLLDVLTQLDSAFNSDCSQTLEVSQMLRQESSQVLTEARTRELRQESSRTGVSEEAKVSEICNDDMSAGNSTSEDSGLLSDTNSLRGLCLISLANRGGWSESTKEPFPII
jgi:hypothetical protein